MSDAVVPPNAVIGILGGGQLGRMTALAAARLGYRCHVLAPEESCPASHVCERHIQADYEDPSALDALASVASVVTYEFENVPAGATTGLLERGIPVRPTPRALEVAQHRVTEKRFAGANGVAVTRFGSILTEADLAPAADAAGFPAILKTCRFGYDGKGQARVADASGLADAWASIGRREAILEAAVPFEREVSVIVARGIDRAVRSFPVVENRHEDGILATTTAPAGVSPEVAAKAVAAAEALALALDLVGLLAVEFFVTADGDVLMNEMAPRPHNSGHWTQDGCATDQFEQLVRAICGLPLGPVDIVVPTVMRNLIGDAVDEWPGLLADPAARLHLYGKAEARPGRKMGHVNLLGRRERGS